MKNPSPINWDDSQHYLPLPRHRRKMILSLLRSIQFKDILDAGCAQHYLIADIAEKFKANGFGCDFSADIIKVNQLRAPHIQFKQVDLEKETWSDKQFDVVICSEVIEHISEWQNAVKNIAAMSKKYLLITVPGGKKRKIDEIVGHYRHYEGSELHAELEKQGFSAIKTIRHGFPIHSLYKRVINLIKPEKLYSSFHSGKKYSWAKKVFSHALYLIFHINWLFSSGDQIYILAKRK